MFLPVIHNGHLYLSANQSVPPKILITIVYTAYKAVLAAEANQHLIVLQPLAICNSWVFLIAPLLSRVAQENS